MLTKQDIINEIRQKAKENSGKPLGIGRFEKETGIRAYDWGKYWARFGDALIEAGFEPNKLQESYSDNFVIEKLIDLIRKLGKFPTIREIRIERNNNTEFPSKGAFNRRGTKRQIALKVLDYCRDKNDYQDIIALCNSVIESVDNEQDEHKTFKLDLGEVYLFKSGKYYKIGKTNDRVRRGQELKIQLPEKVDLIHSIKTDDPSGVEAYWHRRFETKRMLGEWFNLDSEDIRAFKRWRRIH